jgi:redox-sensitive bicupin YhaK (pirin superfamily)
VNFAIRLAQHSFDPPAFRSLRLLNYDAVIGGAGFDTHPRRDMEIISFARSGQ